MKKIVTRIIILLLIAPFLVKAQQDIALKFQPVNDIAIENPPNFVIDSGEHLSSQLYYDKYGQLKGINNYWFITNMGGPGIINVEIKVDEFTENKQFTVEGLTNYALVTSVPVWQGIGVEMVISTALPEIQLNRTFTGISATGETETTLDPGLAARDWYWFDYELWDYENIFFENNMFTIVGELGKIFTSFDGNSWELKGSGTNADLSGITFGNGQWVTTAWDGFIYTSETTKTWTERIQVTEWLSGAAYGGGRFVAVGEAIYTSGDGITWSEAGSGSYNFSGINYLNNTFIAVGDGIYTSANGTSWTQVLPQPSNTHISGIAYGNGVYVSIGWIWDSGRGDGVVYTSSNGLDWTQQSLNISGIKGIDKVAFGNGKFMAVGDGGAIIESTNGITWTSVPSGTNESLSGVAFGNGLFVVVGMGGGTILNYGELTDISNYSTNLPEHFILCQNYPNPFNPTTRIQYYLNEQTNVEIKIFNTLGAVVEVLVNQTQLAGSHIVIFNANNLASGIYYYQMRTNKFVDTKKLLLLK